MYFNENKEETNIDSEFKSKREFEFKKYKKIFIIVGIILLALILLLIISAILRGKNKYRIDLNGSREMTIYQGAPYNEPGYTAYDNKHNDLTNQVEIKQNLDSNTIGTYTIIYSLNNKSVKRIVNVIARQNVTTTIHLTGEKNVYLKVGDSYTDPGCTAIDAIDGNLTDQVITNSNVNTSEKGVYRIIYSVVNSSGITTSELRTIIVQ